MYCCTSGNVFMVLLFEFDDTKQQPTIVMNLQREKKVRYIDQMPVSNGQQLPLPARQAQVRGLYDHVLK